MPWGGLLLGLLLLLLFAPLVVGVIAVLVMGVIGACLVRHEKPPSHRPSDIYFQKRKYLSWNSIHGWPREAHLFYECANCHQALPSQPKEPRECSCGNLFITPEHIGAQDPSRVLIYEETLVEGQS